MFKKYTLLTILGLLSGTQANGNIIGMNWGTVWNKLHKLTDLYKGDVVLCKSDSHSFEVAARSSDLEEKTTESNFPTAQLLKKRYADKAKLAKEKTGKEFYNCMSDLEHPETAVRSGEYKKCVAQAWAQRPWLTSTTIDLRANYKPEIQNGWYMFCQKFGRFERELPSTFLD